MPLPEWSQTGDLLQRVTYVGDLEEQERITMQHRNLYVDCRDKNKPTQYVSYTGHLECLNGSSRVDLKELPDAEATCLACARTYYPWIGEKKRKGAHG